MKKQIFSNGSAFTYWHIQNCDECTRYEYDSTKIENAGCKAAFEIDLGSFGSGEISDKAAEYVGFENNKINDICKNLKK